MQAFDKILGKNRLLLEDNLYSLPGKNKESIRFMTYNVHAFRSADNVDKRENIKKLIEEINPDILCLQEHTGDIKFDNLPYFVIATSEHTMYNSIYSNIPLTHVTTIRSPSDRCAVVVSCTVNDQIVYIINTHLALYSEDRKILMKKILNNAYSFGPNVIIVGDFNSYRMDDYDDKQMEELKKIKENIIRPNENIFDIPQLLEDNYYVDSFEKGSKNNHPINTTIHGGRIDYIYLKSDMKVKITYSGTYYTSHSDHLPIICDVKFDLPEYFDDSALIKKYLGDKLIKQSINHRIHIGITTILSANQYSKTWCFDYNFVPLYVNYLISIDYKSSAFETFNRYITENTIGLFPGELGKKDFVKIHQKDSRITGNIVSSFNAYFKDIYPELKYTEINKFIIEYLKLRDTKKDITNDDIKTLLTNTDDDFFTYFNDLQDTPFVKNLLIKKNKWLENYKLNIKEMKLTPIKKFIDKMCIHKYLLNNYKNSTTLFIRFFLTEYIYQRSIKTELTSEQIKLIKDQTMTRFNNIIDNINERLENKEQHEQINKEKNEFLEWINEYKKNIIMMKIEPINDLMSKVYLECENKKEKEETYTRSHFANVLINKFILNLPRNDEEIIVYRSLTRSAYNPYILQYYMKLKEIGTIIPYFHLQSTGAVPAFGPKEKESDDLVVLEIIIPKNMPYYAGFLHPQPNVETSEILLPYCKYNNSLSLTYGYKSLAYEKRHTTRDTIHKMFGETKVTIMDDEQYKLIKCTNKEAFPILVRNDTSTSKEKFFKTCVVHYFKVQMVELEKEKIIPLKSSTKRIITKTEFIKPTKNRLFEVFNKSFDEFDFKQFIKSKEVYKIVRNHLGLNIDDLKELNYDDISDEDIQTLKNEHIKQYYSLYFDQNDKSNVEQDLGGATNQEQIKGGYQNLYLLNKSNYFSMQNILEKK